MVHIDYAISKIQAEEYLKMKLEYKQYPQFVVMNTQKLVKISKGKDQNTFMLANKLQRKIHHLDAKMEQKPSILSMVFSIHESFRKFIQDQSLKKNWADYDEVVSKQLHYWAKTGEFEKF